MSTAATKSLEIADEGDPEEQDQHRGHQRAAARAGQTDEQADDGTTDDHVGVQVHRRPFLVRGAVASHGLRSRFVDSAIIIGRSTTASFYDDRRCELSNLPRCELEKSGSKRHDAVAMIAAIAPR